MATLVYSDTDGIDRSFSLGAEPVLVGRGTECAIRSDDPRVSRNHARFFIDQGQLWVEDLGSSNGIFVGPQKVQKAPVPVGEIVLVGSLMIRLLPASGTLPPPVGLHGTLAQWLEMERKARATIEEERNAFAKRVGELHEEIRPLKDAQSAHNGEAVALRDELDTLRKASAQELESTRLDLAKAREAKMIAETQAGMTVAEKLAEADMTIPRLEHQLEQLRAAHSAPPDTGLADQVTMLTGRAEKAEKELASAQIRAQGAERNLTAANTQAARAETRAAELTQKVADAVAARAKVDGEAAALREKLAAVETRLGAGDAPLVASEARAAKLAGELAEVKASLEAQLEAARRRHADLERDVEAARQAVTAAGAAGSAHADKHAQALARIGELETRLANVSGAEEKIEVARKERETARERAASADLRIGEMSARADEAEKRATAADTMAKAMAKDVAEALRRAVDADSRARSVIRELDGAHRRADEAERRDGELRAAAEEAKARAIEAETKLTELRDELTARFARAQDELTTKADHTERELSTRLEQAQRELAAERSTAMNLVDRKTQLERELEAARTMLAGLQHRVELAEGKVAEYEVTIDQLEERIEDLESAIAVEQTASRSSLGEARDRIERLESELETVRKARADSETSLGETRGALDRAVDEARASAEAALSEARTRIVELERLRAGTSSEEQERLVTAERRVVELEARIDPLAARSEAGDLAIARAEALQRQLDDALQRLAWLEHDNARTGADEALSEQLAAADQRAREAAARAHDAEARAVREADRARDVETRAKEIEARAKDIEQRAKDAAERIVDAERRARDAESRLADARRRDDDDGEPTADGGDELAAARARILELQREVDAADNVRQFAASTEREIAQLQRELRDAKAKLAQAALERDRFESQLHDLRDDSETRMHSARGAPAKANRTASVTMDPEATAMADMTRYSELVNRSAELEQRLADAEGRLAAQARAREDEPTNTGHAMPIEFAEHLSMLEEAIDALRANMRAASDETAMMDQTDSVIAVASAVSQAAEHVERARDAVRVLTMLVKT